MKYSIHSQFYVRLLRQNKIDVCFCVCFNVMGSTVPLGYEDKIMEGNCFVLLMNDDEYTSVCLWG